MKTGSIDTEFADTFVEPLFHLFIKSSKHLDFVKQDIFTEFEHFPKYPNDIMSETKMSDYNV